MLDAIFKFSHLVKLGPLSFTISVSGIVEMLVFAVLIYYVAIWIKKTKAWNLLKGVAVLLAIYLIAWLLGLNNLIYLFKVLFGSFLVAMIVIFQPEIRKALEQLGERNFFKRIVPSFSSNPTTALSADSVEKIVNAMTTLGKNKTGALICIERKILLDEYIQTGIQLNAVISTALLEQIFEHNTPLHDGAVIIRENKIASATCYLPLSENQSISKELGTRHRAGLGISEMSDCITLIASEETGHLSVAIGGKLTRNISSSELRDLLNNTRLMGEEKQGKDDIKKLVKNWRGRKKK